jgi:hypothetical protein
MNEYVWARYKKAEQGGPGVTYLKDFIDLKAKMRKSEIECKKEAGIWLLYRMR